MSSTDVVITGLGAVSPLGLTVDHLWQGLCEGKSGIDTIKSFDPTEFPCRSVGTVPPYRIRDFVPKTYRKAVKLFSRDIELAVIAAAEAFADSKLSTKATRAAQTADSAEPADITAIDPERTAVNLGAGLIICDLVELGQAVAECVTDGKFDIRKFGSEGMLHIPPLWLLKYLPNMLACHVAIIHDIQGPNNTITCAEASAQLAIIEAVDIIARGSSDVALAGAAETRISPLAIARQSLLKRVAEKYNDSPSQACRPFDADASGSVFGEAGAVVVLENMENAQSRKADILARVAGTGQSCSINPQLERLEPDGTGLAIAIEQALTNANITPDQLDLIIPHGTAIAADDLAEAKAIESVLGEAVKTVPVWPTKSLLSNTGAAGGGLDLIAAVCAMKNNFIPPAANLDKKAPGCNLNIVCEPVEKKIRYALCCSYTYGGQTTAVVLENVS